MDWGGGNLFGSAPDSDWDTTLSLLLTGSYDVLTFFSCAYYIWGGRNDMRHNYIWRERNDRRHKAILDRIMSID